MTTKPQHPEVLGGHGDAMPSQCSPPGFIQRAANFLIVDRESSLNLLDRLNGTRKMTCQFTIVIAPAANGSVAFMLCELPVVAELLQSSSAQLGLPRPLQETQQAPEVSQSFGTLRVKDRIEVVDKLRDPRLR